MTSKNNLTFKTAFWLSVSITVVLQLFFVISFNLRDPMMERGPRPPVEHAIDYSRLIATSIFQFTILFCLYLLNFKIFKGKMNDTKKTIMAILLSLGLTIIFSFIITRIQMIIFDVPQMDFRKPMKGHFVRDLFLMIIVVFTSQILYLSQKRQQIASKYEALQAENMKIRYEALKNQIDPHFFFNTLSSLYFLIETDTQKAQDYTHKISSVYRYTLQNKESVTLRNEIEFTKDYASLVQIRYGEQLSIIFNIDEKYLDYEIVPLSIQTLVENAIKHNIISNKQPLTVTIQTTSDNMITVSNNLQTKEISEPGEGIGLSNLAERYRLRWQKNIIIKNNGETFSVTVPLHQNATM